ncbi:hypothetical protein FRC18_010728 [Serendipita sp. 400]|nr:hypothetical protein FRC18_010728 [Serendipita sp. 400]
MVCPVCFACFVLTWAFLNDPSFHPILSRNRSTNDDTLREAFSAHGNVLDSIVMRDAQTGRSRGFGFVTYGSQAEADAAIASLHDQDLDGRRIKPKYTNVFFMCRVPSSKHCNLNNQAPDMVAAAVADIIKEVAEAMEVKEDTAAAVALKVATVVMVVILVVMALVVDTIKEVQVADMAKVAMGAVKVVMALVDKGATVAVKEAMVVAKVAMVVVAKEVMAEDKLDMGEDQLPMGEEAKPPMVLLAEAINIKLATANRNNNRVNKGMAAAAVAIRRRTKRAMGRASNT